MEPWIAVLMCLASCFHRIHGMTNWALEKKSSQSSTASIANASLAVDGRRSQRFLVPVSKAVCTHTNESVSDRRWWVDLGQTENVSKVLIYNRGEGYGGRLHNFFVEVGYIKTKDRNESFETCRYYRFPDMPIINISCKPVTPLTGRYVQIRKETFKSEKLSKKFVTLTLCEVQVYGPDKPEVNLALKKKAFQSTEDYGGNANLATDGFLGRNFSNITLVPQCAQTEGNRTRPWWRVDMGHIVNVTNVTLFNQIEDVETVIRNYTIEVGRSQTDESIKYQTCRYFEKTANSVIKAACNSVVIGQYLRIMKLGPMDTDPLTLCEVEVFGIGLSQYPVKPKLVQTTPVIGADWTLIIIAIAFSLLFILIVLAIAAYVFRRRRNKAPPAKADDTESIKSGSSSAASPSSATESKSEASSAGPEAPSVASEPLSVASEPPSVAPEPSVASEPPSVAPEPSVASEPPSVASEPPSVAPEPSVASEPPSVASEPPSVASVASEPPSVAPEPPSVAPEPPSAGPGAAAQVAKP